MVRGRDKFYKFKRMIYLFVEFFSIFPARFRITAFEYCRMIQGFKGLGIRYVLLKTLAKRCGNNVSLHPGVYLLNPQNISIGNNVSIHPMCYIDCSSCESGGVIIGNDVSIAHNVSIMSTSHKFDDLTIPIKDQGLDSKKVVIEDGVWIGAKATVLYGNRLGAGSIIAANAVITQDVPPNTIVGGVPARMIRRRFKEDEQDEGIIST